MKGFRFVTAAVLCGVWLGGCSSSSKTSDVPPVPETPPSSSQTAYLIDDQGLVAHRLIDGTNETIEAGIEFGGETWKSPDQMWTAALVQKDGSDFLSLINKTGSYRIVQGPIMDAEFTVVWAPTSDSLLVGVNTPGGGQISVYNISTSSLSDIGCSSSNQALSWGRDDWFVVGNGTSHYMVERDGCATLETVDARKLHEVTFGPLGQHVAYILRELEYDREAREYRPDSSLYVADAVGLDPVLVAGNRYRPHRPAWSNNANSLAFDARLLDDETRRLISIYDVADKQSAFLNPEAVESKVSEWAPAWSPSGEAIAYMQSSRGDRPVVAVRTMATSFSTIVGKPGEVLAGWIGDRQLALRGDSSSRVVGLDGKEILVLNQPVSILTFGVSMAPVETGSTGSN